MNRSCKILLLFLIAIAVNAIARSEGLPDDFYKGRYSNDPIIITGGPEEFEIAHEVDTYQWSLHKFYPDTIYFDFILNADMTVVITTLGSVIKYTELRIFEIKTTGDTLRLNYSTDESYHNLLRSGECWNGGTCWSTQDRKSTRLNSSHLA